MSERNDGPGPRHVLQLTERAVLHWRLLPRHRRSLASDLEPKMKYLKTFLHKDIFSNLILFFGHERLVTVSGGWSMVLGGHLREEHLNQV